MGTNELERDLRTEILVKTGPYIGMTRQQLKQVLQIETKAKNINNILAVALLSSFTGGSPITTEELKAANILLKTVPVTYSGKVKESMSFSAIDFLALASGTWKTSTLYELLSENTFLFFVFQEDAEGEISLAKVMLWDMPEEDLTEVQKVWEKTASVIREGIHEWSDGRSMRNDLPKATENRVAHVRPHARDSADTAPLPDGSFYIKQSFWLNSKYIEKVIGAVSL